jgi:hypothetical protein
MMRVPPLRAFRKRRSMQVGLKHLRFAGLCGISVRDFLRRTQILGPHFGAILRRVISKPSIAATGIQNFPAVKKLSRGALACIRENFDSTRHTSPESASIRNQSSKQSATTVHLFSSRTVA